MIVRTADKDSLTSVSSSWCLWTDCANISDLDHIHILTRVVWIKPTLYYVNCFFVMWRQSYKHIWIRSPVLALYSIVLYCSVLYLHYTVLYCIVLYSTCTTLYCTVLYCTVLYKTLRAFQNPIKIVSFNQCLVNCFLRPTGFHIFPHFSRSAWSKNQICRCRSKATVANNINALIIMKAIMKHKLRHTNKENELFIFYPTENWKHSRESLRKAILSKPHVYTKHRIIKKNINIKKKSCRKIVAKHCWPNVLPLVAFILVFFAG